jgi:hypothetical protein
VYVLTCVALFCAAAYFLGRTDGVKTVTICPLRCFYLVCHLILSFCVLFNRVVVVSSLLLTIPVDSLIASSTWRRMYNRYVKLVAPKYHHPSDTSGSSRSARCKVLAVSDGQNGLIVANVGSSEAHTTQDEEALLSRPYESEHSQENASAPCTTADAPAHLRSHSSSTSTANEFGQYLVLSSQDASAILSHPKNVITPATTANTTPAPEGRMEESPQRRTSLACSPPQVTLSHLNMLMNDAPPVSGLRQNDSTGSLSSAGGKSGDVITDRRSFTSTGTGTSVGTGAGRASSTTGSGVAGHRMISKDEMESILRANSFDTKSRKSATKSQHEQVRRSM